MKFKFILITSLITTGLFANSTDGYQLIKNNGCLSCHAIASKKSAPAFAGIAKRNTKFYGSGAKTVIIRSIKNGSKGKYPYFNNTAMPAFDNLTLKELRVRLHK